MDYYETAEGVESKVPAYSRESLKKLLILGFGVIASFAISCGLLEWVDLPGFLSSVFAFVLWVVTPVAGIVYMVQFHRIDDKARKTIINDIEVEKPGFKQFYAVYQKHKAEEDAEKQRIILRGIVVGVSEGYRAHKAIRQVGRDIKKEFRKY
jgi:hypothetical protein